MPFASWSRRAALFGLAGAAAACTTSVPDDLLLSATTRDIAAPIRLPADASGTRWRRHLDPTAMQGSPTILALSGGSEDGAFGAGLLTGLSEIGQRPDPDILTGISTGALMASLVFQGARGDPALRAMYTEHSARDVFRLRGLPGLIGTSVFDPQPLQGLMATHLDDAAMAEIARRHSAGKRLFVVTSNLDTGAAMVWNMGAIAQRGDVELFRAVIMASASIPGVFPPVTLRISDGDESFRETHVDGGVNLQFFAIPDAALTGPTGVAPRGGHLYVIINNRIEPRPQPVPRTTIAIMSRAISTMIRSSASESLERTQQFAARTGLGLSAAAIGSGFDVAYDPTKPFSPDYMRPLFDYGYQRAISGRAWEV